MAERKLLLTHYQKTEAAFLLEQEKLVQIMINSGTTCRIGEIYVGKVKNIVPGISAAFVEFTRGKIGFLPLSNLKKTNIISRTDATELKCGDEILVQISKEPLKSKEATLTTDISFSGKYLVLIPFSHGIHYSKKFTPQQKDTLRETIQEVSRQLFGDTDIFKSYGLIVRTNAAQADLFALGDELHNLFHKAGSVVKSADKRTVFSCLYKEASFFENIIKNHFSVNSTEILTDSPYIYEQLLARNDKDIAVALRYYDQESFSLLQLYGLSSKISEALSKKVWLKSGGYLIIEPTEALTVIDVNSGKSTPAQNRLEPEEFYFKVNKEAAAEVARQLRLRNISGIVIVDFLKLKDPANIEMLLQFLKMYLHRDPVETIVCGMTSLGLVEITRKKTEAPLSEKIQQLGKE